MPPDIIVATHRILEATAKPFSTAPVLTDPVSAVNIWYQGFRKSTLARSMLSCSLSPSLALPLSLSFSLFFLFFFFSFSFSLSLSFFFSLEGNKQLFGIAPVWIGRLFAHQVSKMRNVRLVGIRAPSFSPHHASLLPISPFGCSTFFFICSFHTTRPNPCRVSSYITIHLGCLDRLPGGVRLLLPL